MDKLQAKRLFQLSSESSLQELSRSTIEKKPARAVATEEEKLERERDAIVLRMEATHADIERLKSRNKLIESKIDVKRVEKEIQKQYEARDTAQYEMREVKGDLENVEADVEKEMTTLKRMDNVTVNDLDDGEGPSQLGNMTVDQEKRLKTNVKKAMWQLGKEKAVLRSLKQKLMSYESVWAEILKGTGCESMEELIEKFREFERTVR
jgi:hypothetical protein